MFLYITMGGARSFPLLDPIHVVSIIGASLSEPHMISDCLSIVCSHSVYMPVLNVQHFPRAK